MVTLLVFIVKIWKSILKSSNFTILGANGNISWCRYLFRDRGARGVFALRKTFDLLQNGPNRWESISKLKNNDANS